MKVDNSKGLEDNMKGMTKEQLLKINQDIKNKNKASLTQFRTEPSHICKYYI